MLKSESRFRLGKIQLLVKVDDKIPEEFSLIRKLLGVFRYHDISLDGFLTQIRPWQDSNGPLFRKQYKVCISAPIKLI